VLRQTHSLQEILVADDGSTDDTAAVLAPFANRLRHIRLPHGGAAAARNAGIRASMGDVVAFLDADDEWLERKLERQLPLHRAPAVTMSYCRSQEFAPDGRDLGDTFRERAPLRGEGLWRELLAANFIATPTVMARRSDLLALGGFDERLKVGEDQDMWIRLALKGSVDFIDDTLVRVHQQPGSLSSSGLQDQLQFTFAMVERHLKALAHLLRPEEVLSIRATRLGKIGRDAYAQGKYASALPLIAAAMRAGDRPARNIYHLLAASPPVRGVKSILAAGPSRGGMR